MVLLSGCDGESTNDPPDSVESEACVQGTLTFTHYEASTDTILTEPAASAHWSLAMSSPEGTTPNAVSGLTDPNGTFAACLPAGADDTTGTLTFSTEREQLWAVVDPLHDAEAYTFSPEEFTLDPGTTELGELEVPDETAGAFKVVASITALYELRASGTPCWTAHQTTLEQCHVLTVTWNQDTPEDEGGFWDRPDTGDVVLSEVDTSSRYVVVHEAAHWWHNELYDGDFPEVTGCDPHYVEEPSSPSCAWTEGFADAVAAWTLGQPHFVSSDGHVSPFSPEDGCAWPGGDSTQGNVAAALMDLWRLDSTDGTWDANVHALTITVSGDFGGYFDDARPAAGLSTDGDALTVLQERGISH